MSYARALYKSTTLSGVTGPTGPAGSSSGSGLAGVTTVDDDGLVNGAQITSSNYLQLGAATETYPGVVTTGVQTFAGAKSFTSDLTVNGLTVGSGVSIQPNNTVVGIDAMSTSDNSVTNSVAFGLFAMKKATTGTNVAIGVNSLYSSTTGNKNTAIGYNALYRNKTGDKNVAIGDSAGTVASITNLSNTIAIGYNATTTASNTIQMGNSDIIQMNTSGTIGVGTYSTDVDASGITGSIYYNTTDSALKVYDGSTWSSIGSGSGLTGPTGSIGYTGYTGSNGTSYTGPTGSNGTSYTGPTGTSYWSTNANAIYYNNGNVGIGNSSPSYPLDVSGNGRFTGTVNAATFNTTSDYRIKESVKLIDENYTIDKLRPVIYINKQTLKTDMGLIAHELQECYPFLVNGEKDGNEKQSVNYIGLIALLIKEMQEFKKEIHHLKKEIKKLQNRE